MEKNIPIHLQEIIFGSSDSSIAQQISKLQKEGVIKKIAPKIYTSQLDISPENIVKRNIFTIIGHQYPNAVLSHRSAIEFKLTSTNKIFITYSYTKKVALPGVTIQILEGKKPIEGDNLFTGGLYVSQRERALLENLQTSRKTGADSKTLSFPEIEEYLENIIRVNGEGELNKIRDKAREISVELNMKKEFTKLDKLIGALLTTKTSKILKSPLATARAFGEPYDPKRLELLEFLCSTLNQKELPIVADKNITPSQFKNFAFFESYFSNYIEGTQFSIDDAKQIVDSQQPLPNRNEDSHDILGTYQIISNKMEMVTTPKNAKELINIIEYRHAILMKGRIDKNPGKFKNKNNRAGQTEFVDMNLVRGTLIKGFDYYQVLQQPLAKAIFMMFMISEIHPFLDGNGRIARVMMNAELVKEKQSRIIIPTVFRDDYLGALRQLTRQDKPEAFIRMLTRAQKFSSTIYGENLDELQLKLERSNAFLEDTEGKLKIIDY